MEAELNSLESRLAALLEAYQALRTENSAMNARVATLQLENRRMGEKLSVVTERIEKILARLPLEDEAQ